MQTTAIKIVQGDITTRAVDAIVNAANETLLGGGGVDGAIHDAAGPELLEECIKLGGCATGMAKSTKPYWIRQAKWLIHTVGPVFGRESGREAILLASCYTESLRLAVSLGCRTIAFPSISTGAFGFPIGNASLIALTAISDFVRMSATSLDLIEVVTFSREDYQIYQRTFRRLFGESALHGE